MVRNKHVVLVVVVSLVTLLLVSGVVAGNTGARSPSPAPVVAQPKTSAPNAVATSRQLAVQMPQPIYRSNGTIDVGPILRAKDLPIEGIPSISTSKLPLPQQLQATPSYTIGSQIRFLALDDYRGRYFLTTYTVMTITTHSEVWVQNDLSYRNLDGTVNAIHPDAKDPQYVTMDRINALAKTFDDIIYSTDTHFFGTPNSLDGTNSLLPSLLGLPAPLTDDGSRIVILVSNVRDTNFYFPVQSGSFIAGFYSPTFEAYSDRNMITIDSKQWNERVGASANPDREYTYDDTLAHEFQHLIHDDYSPNEDSWVNEGMSGFAEFLNGYFITPDLGGRQEWQKWPQNSVIVWGDQDEDTPEHGRTGSEILADYQLVNSFMLYTAGRIGGIYTDTAKLTDEPENGILGFNKWLSDTSATNPAATGLTFESLFKDFRRDMLFGGDTNGAQPQANWKASFIGNYNSPLHKSGGPATTPEYLGLLRDSLGPEGYDTPGVPPFGTNFIGVCWSPSLSTVSFDGDEKPPKTAWSAVAASDIYTPTGNVSGDVLYSDHTDYTDNFVIFGPITPTASDNLTFDHYFNIEETWDYGFVQVTTDTTGLTGWTSLNMAHMITETDPSAHPIIKENVPGFSGFSGGWLTQTYPLGAAYSGQPILLAFRYSTDWGTAGNDGVDSPPGWAIDNVKVGSQTLTTGAVNGGRSIQQVRNAGPQYAFEFLTWGNGNAVTVTHVYTAALNASQAGTINLSAISASDTGFDQAGERGVIMLSQMLDSFKDLIGGGILPQYGDYSLTGLPPSICTSKVDAWALTHAGQSRVYAGEVMTASVHVDNLGSSPNVTTTAASRVYVGVPIPAGTTFKSASGGASYTSDLSLFASTFPARPGVYWVDVVTRTYDFDVALNANPNLVDGTTITTTAYFANSFLASPTQAFTNSDTVRVISAFGLSAEVAQFAPIRQAKFVAKVLNVSHAPKTVQIVADNPTDTTFVGVTGATVVATSTTQITVTQVITDYNTLGTTTDVTFQWRLGSSYHPRDPIVSTMKIIDPVTGDTHAVDATGSAAVGVYLPLISK